MGETAQSVNEAPPSGQVVNVAGSLTPGNADGPSASARFNDPAGLAIQPDGSIFVADWGNNAIRRISADGTTVTTFAKSYPNLVKNPRMEVLPSPATNPPTSWNVVSGTWRTITSSSCGTCGNSADGSAWVGGKGDYGVLQQDVDFNYAPYDALVAAGGQGYTLDGDIRLSAPNLNFGTIRLEFLTAAGALVGAVNCDSNKDIWFRPPCESGTVPPTARKVRIKLIARPDGETYFDSVSFRLRDATQPGAELRGPQAVAILPSGSILIGGRKLYIANSSGTSITEEAPYPELNPITSIVALSDSFAYSTTSNRKTLDVRDFLGGKSYRADVGGVANGEPIAVTGRIVGGVHKLLVAYRGSTTIKAYDCPKGTVDWSTVTCTPSTPVAQYGSTSGFVNDIDGTNGGERFGQINALGVDALGGFFAAEEGNNAIRRIMGPYTLTTAGSGTRGLANGASNQAMFSSPTGVAVTAGGDVIVADRRNNTIRKILCGATNVCAPSGDSCPKTPIDDGNICTTDSCEVVVVRHDPNTLECDDDNNCTYNDWCSQGVCHSGHPAPIDDGQFCTIDSCDPQTGVLHTPIAEGTECDDDNNCTYNDWCSQGVCHSGHPAPIDDGQFCTIDSCNPQTGVVLHTPIAEGTECDDDNNCTYNDWCSQGVCHPGVPANLDDQQLCTIDSCDLQTGVVLHTPKTYTDTNLNDCLVPQCDPASGNAIDVPAPEGTPCGVPAGTGRRCNNTGTCETNPPPVLALTAPLTDRYTSLGDATLGIWSGGSATQTPIAGGSALSTVIEPKRAGWLVGYVKTPEGNGMANVTVTVISDTKFGKTTTLADGRFDLIVNGGASYTLRFEKAQHLSADRTVYVGWEETAAVDDVVLIGLDQTPNDPIVGYYGGWSKGRSVTDSSGTRTATLMIPSGTDIRKGPPGAEVRIYDSRLRLTEYTEGPDGPKRMPAPLGQASGYTYAVEISSDDAPAGERISFTKDVYVYVNNFLGFPSGTDVPAGYYDWDKRAWIASKNGRVIKILATSPLEIDVNGDGSTDAATSVNATAIGFTAEEFAALPTQLPDYAAGKTYWRVPINHLTPWDFNYPVKCEGNVCPNPPPPPPPPPECRGSGPTKDGSIIHCDSQGLGEEVPVAGTPFKLTYNSVRAPGYAAHRQIRIPITGPTVHSKLHSIIATVAVAGQITRKEFNNPFSPNMVWNYEWDGKDGAGNAVTGSAVATVSTTTNFMGDYLSWVMPDQTVNSFGRPEPATGGTTVANSTRPSGIVTASSTVTLQGRYPTGTWLVGGAWSLTPHHFYDPKAAKLYLGSGTSRAISGAPVITKVPDSSFNAAGGEWSGVAVAPNGDIILADNGNRRVRRLSNGAMTIIAGNGNTPVGPTCLNGDDGTAALSASIGGPQGVAVAADGTIYITASKEHTVRVLKPSGGTYTIKTIAGTKCTAGATGDGALATAAKLDTPSAVALGPEGAVYVLDSGNNKIRRIDASGIISTVAGKSGGSVADGAIATEALLSFGSEPAGLAVARDGTIFFHNSSKLARVDPWTGRIRYLSSTSTPPPAIQEGVLMTTQGASGGWGALALFADGRIAFDDNDSTRTQITPNPGLTHLRVVDKNGYVASVSHSSSANPAPPTDFANPLADGPSKIISLASAPNGDLIAADGSLSVYRIQTQTPLTNKPCAGITAAWLIPDGDSGYCFDANGRHLRTINTRTGAALFKFDYSNGNVIQIETPQGKISISEPATVDGTTTWKIKAPHLQETTITAADGTYATKIENAKATATFVPLANGLLDNMTDRGGNVFDFSYATDGRLTVDQSPIGSQQLASSVTATGGRAVTFTTPRGQVTTYTVEKPPSGGTSLTTTYPDLTAQTTVSKLDGSTVVTQPDGTMVTTSRRADPTWGGLALTSSTTTTSFPKNRSSNTNLKSTTEEIVCKAKSATPPGGVLTTTQYSGTALNPSISLTCDNADPPNVSGSAHTTVKRVTTSAIDTITYTSAAGRTRLEERDALGRPTKTQIGNLTPIVNVYNAAVGNEGQLMSTTQGGRVHSYQYRSDSEADPLIAGTTPAWDAGFVKLVTNPNGVQTTYVRDFFGIPRKMTEAANSTFPAMIQSTLFQTEGNDNLSAVTPPGRPTHSLTYDGIQQLSLYTPPSVTGTGTTSFVSNSDRLPGTETRPDNSVITYTYVTSPRATGQLDTVVYPGAGAPAEAPSGTLDFDYFSSTDTNLASGQAPGKLKSIKGPYGSTMLEYEHDGRLTTKVKWSNVNASTESASSVTWSYGTNLLPATEVVTPISGTAHTRYFAYDADRLLTCNKGSSGSCAAMVAGDYKLTLSAEHQGVADMTFGFTNATTAILTEHWDYSDSAPDEPGQSGADTDVPNNRAFGQLRRQTLTSNASNKLAKITYDVPQIDPRDAMGRVVTKTEEFTLGGTSTSVDIGYVYDDRNRLQQVTANDIPEETFEYDANGNRTTYTPAAGPGRVGKYDAQDRLLYYGSSAGWNSATGTISATPQVGDVQYTYQPNGELAQRIIKSAAGNDVWQYTYDVLGNLVAVVKPGASSTTYTYLVDGAGRRIGKREKVGSGTDTLKRRWIYRDQLSPVAEMNAAGQLTAVFVYGSKRNIPDLVIKIDPNNGTKTTYRLFSDQLGSPRVAVNVDNVADVPYRVDYSAFGKPTWKGTGAEALDWIPFGFAGGLFDRDTGLVRFGARDYDAETGRWVAKDPIRFGGRQTNLYNYLDGDPVNKTDPTGLASGGDYAACYACQAARIFVTGACGAATGPVGGIAVGLSTAALCAIVCKPVLEDIFPSRVPEPPHDPFGDEPPGGMCEPPDAPEPQQCGG